MLLPRLLTTILESPITGLALGLVSIWLAFYFDRKNRQVKRLSFHVASVEQRHWGTVNGVEVTGLTAVLWNAGTSEIRREDLTPTEPITLRVPNGCRIFCARLRTMSRRANNVSIATSPDGIGVYFDSVRILFDFLNPNDGAVFDVVYVGPRDAALTIEGALIGIGSPVPLTVSRLHRLIAVFVLSELMWVFGAGLSGTGSVWLSSVMIAVGVVLYPIYVFVHFSRRQKLVPSTLAEELSPPLIEVPPVTP